MRQRTEPIASDDLVDGPRGRDAGFTIVEVVMTIVLIAMTIVPIIDATITSVRASSTVREVAEVETVLQNAADRVNRAPTLCSYDVYLQAAALAKGWAASQVAASYQYYVPGASALASDPGSWASDASGTACPGGVRTPRLIQMVTITVTSDSGSIKRTMKVVKSDV
ncbi:MAG: type II secretion system protein [Ilumatobacteraceae bacterium]|jgi:Tfp pilus assembly protein PilV